MNSKDEQLNMIAMVTEIVAAYVSNNKMESTDLPSFINLVQRSLLSLCSESTSQLRSSSEGEHSKPGDSQAAKGKRAGH